MNRIILTIFFLTFETTRTIDDLIYILVYSNAKIDQTAKLGAEHGQQYFIKNNCRVQNCFLTLNRSYFSDITHFDVILFNIISIKDWDLSLPEKRSERQLYIIFLSDEPQSFYPISSRYNGFFNYTWTYKLNSDALFRYIVVKNKFGDVIGPKKVMNWINIDDMQPISDDLKLKLKHKTKAGAWFVSHCETPNQRENYVSRLNSELESYNLKIDIYGHCASLKCLHEDKKCPKLIEKDYYFYLAFENSMYEDYVTEKLLIAIQNYAVPIVYGGANYSRFMPKGTYLDANILEASNLAREINDTVHNKEKYYNFFKWHNHYSYHDPFGNPETDEICAFCAFVNSKRLSFVRNVYMHMTWFWIV